MDERCSVFKNIEDIILLIAFLVVIFLKLLGVINISWFWILSPIWFFCGLFILLVIIAIITGIVTLIIDKIKGV